MVYKDDILCYNNSTMALLLVNKKEKQKSSKHTHYKFWSIVSAVLFFVILASVIGNRSPVPKLSADVNGQIKLDSPLQIKFDWPVARQVEVKVFPKVFGQIEYQDDMVNGKLFKTIVFQPELTWLPATTYEISISNVESAIPSFGNPKQYSLSFTTANLPVINSVSPSQDVEISPDLTWQVNLDIANDSITEYQFVFDPAIEFSTAQVDNNRGYILQPLSLLSQGQEYSLEIFRKDIRYLSGTETLAFQGEPISVWVGTWQVREAPGIVDFRPQGSKVGLDESILFTFSENIDFDSFKDNVIIMPDLEGSWSTEDFITVSFKPKALAKDTSYTITTLAGLSTFDSGYLEEDSTHQFTTLGPVRLASISPSGGGTGASVDGTIRVLFDQAVDQSSVESRFSIIPNVAGSISWEGNTFVYQPASPLDFNTQYAITFESGIDSIAGFVSEETIRSSFTTELSVTKLSVPFHRQDHALSCEVATLVMALRYYGVDITEQPLIDDIGFDPTEKSGNVWGNPHIAFVGDIDGRQPSTGYGVYWQPIAIAGEVYRPTRWFTDWALSDLTNEIKMVIRLLCGGLSVLAHA